MGDMLYTTDLLSRGNRRGQDKQAVDEIAARVSNVAILNGRVGKVYPHIGAVVDHARGDEDTVANSICVARVAAEEE